MNRNTMRNTFGLFLCAALLLTGCTARTDPAAPGPGEVAMGRYIEEEQALPPEINTISAAHRDENGAITLLASDAIGLTTNADHWKFYRTTDKGATWTSWPEDGLDAPRGLAVTAADFDRDGVVHLVCYDGNSAVPDPTVIRQISPEDVDAQPPAGVSIPVDIVTGLRVADSGDYFVHSLYTIEQYSAQGEYLRDYAPSDSFESVRSFLCVGDELAVFMGSRLLFYDTGAGGLLRQVDIPQGSMAEDVSLTRSTLHYAAAEDAYYLCSAAGLFRYAAGGELVEHLAQDDLTSFGVPTMREEGLLVLDDRILVWFGGSQSCTLLRYTWDPDTPAVPSRTLHVYSLYDNPLLRQAGAAFLRDNPDVLVHYEVGMDGGYPTVQDAVSNLNTRMLAGDGPDVLVLDDLPLESFAEQGALLDLSGLLVGDLLEPIASTYRREDGTAYAIPARFGVPVLLGGDDAIASVHSLSDLVDWGVARQAQSGDPELRVLRITQPEALVREWFALCYPAWVRPDGSLDRERVAEFLECALALRQTRPLQNEYFPEMNPFVITGDWWYEGEHLLEAGVLDSPFRIKTPYLALAMREEGALVPLSLQAGAVYVPRTVLAACSGSAQPELALDYIRCALSEPVQSINQNDGFAVNAAAFDAMTSAAYWEGLGSYVVVGDEVVDTGTPWPPEETLAQFRALVAGLDTPAYTGDRAPLEIVLAAAGPYFDGAASLEQAVDEIAAKLELYWME